MKLLLNGATSGTNFGDFLFAKMFQEYLQNKVGKENVFWYDSRFALSDFYCERLNYKKSPYKLKDIDAFIYISGGYFCGNDIRFRDYVFRYLRYFFIGLKCIRKKIPIAIIGLEVGIPKNKIIEKIQRKILRSAKLVVVRNKESFEVLKSYGIESAQCTTDTVFAMSSKLYSETNISKELETTCKKLFLHINPTIEQNKGLIEKVVPAINDFLLKHPEYTLVIGMDQYVENQSFVMNDIKNYISSERVIYSYYDNPCALCKVLSKVDVIVTTKLHVGIVGLKLAKSVISFSGHTEKIERLYKQMGISERSISLKKLNYKTACEMLDKFYDQPVIIPDEIVPMANKNFELLDNFIKIEREKSNDKNNKKIN